MNKPLHYRIIEFLLNLELNTSAEREALLKQATLDRSLITQIDVSVAPHVFITSLVAKVMNHGELRDRQDVLESILNVAKHKVGTSLGEVCDNLIIEWRVACEKAGQASRGEVVVQQSISYVYDIFVSYGEGIFDEWVFEVLLPTLSKYLREYFVPSPVHIYQKRRVNESIEHEARIALAHSRCLIAICSNSYFISPVRKYEMAVMLQREKRLGYRTSSNPNVLAFPIYAFGEERFPDIITSWNFHCDCHNYTIPGILESRESYNFHLRVRQFAENVADAVRTTPAWSEAFLNDLIPNHEIIDSLNLHAFPNLSPKWT